ncbi:uncharacterized protein LOC123261806 [Cotesia glomerata]|uniref:PID domain-containing protein n=1 Tax=Cotesia glomerata TaxID=32391 RepID=A0AAV7IDQ4_COTGL|nr:uncharacterized protein LOC123261806 [Cotesia glomerata]XP_044579555.1 uncharacterized protein LOC123261806 [Cotesia glomerata]XP_044579556.1 uncharacterized protein LOC123261806 [Cotesia glomerata]XP_044579557.1 uncharacterized protein LOC123261806 [Cotesia glomerata]XP_044579558.1 uncharacterized protein LOC123261806 [Cotesia glomerata]XP_044579559.1 uncharacterized protein LOC123261806 [Cotesia glomerata]KAH0550501.1 hypothetical protein KQX54_019760 [Cotesia glomerata]
MSCFEGGFRLNDAVSECSMRSKARIDSLFDDTRSVCSSSYGDVYGSIYGNLGDVNLDEQKKINGAVQARIEAMFASVEAEAGEKGECAAAILPVKYLGAAPVGGRIASVRGLQEPLRQLLERMENIVSAELEVSRRGLTFRTSGSIEKTNPFRRIAVWSALRLRVKRLLPDASSEVAPNEYHHAFIPLIGDEQTPGSEDKHADLYRTMRGLATDVNRYPPLFAVVMRRPGAARVLECHVFACSSEEEAVAAAATLYRALLADLDSNRRRPRQTNGLGCVSLASVASSVADYTSIASKNTYNNFPAKVSAPHPVRPPRSKKNSSLSGSTTDGGSTRSVIINNGKVARRKKTSEIRSEDVAEARKRHSLMMKERSVLKELRDDSVRENSREVKRRNSINRNNNEGVNNLRNKIYSGEVQEKIQDENEVHSRMMNNYEKIQRKDKGGFGEGRENNYSFIERNSNNIVGEVFNMPEAQLYERNQCSYDLNKNSSRNEVYDAHRGKKEICQANKCNEDSSKSCDNSIYGRSTRNSRNRSKTYEDHFKDVDKIYTLSQEDVKIPEQKRSSVASSVSSCRHEVIKSDRGRALKKDQLDPRRNMRNQESVYGAGRMQRVSRIDEFSKKVSRSSDAFTSDSSYPKCRKRDRAGSEPPISRTENAAKISQGIKLKRSVSDIEVERGDLLTRVELPRRGSFLKSNSTRLPTNVHGGTPLGFTELFDEFRNQEGLTSVDDILDVIIDPEGMSFNELKPLYKEFLLKLASTLTQDELYQRSANIMKRRRRPQRRRSTRKSCLLGRAIRRSVSKLKTGPTEFTSVIFPAKKFNESFDSSSSCDIRNSRNRVLASRLSRRKPSWRRSSKVANSEDSDTCKRVTRSAGANRSSSGYVSCSECSYDSESCTCVSADKCYCSLPRRSPGQELTAVNNPVICNCDTDSCSESNKCYCATRAVTQPTILEQLRQHGIIPSEGTLSRDCSPERARIIKNSRSHSSSQSLEYHKMRPSPVRSSSDNLALDYDLFSPGKKSQQASKSKNEKVLVVSARDPHGRLVYVGGSDRNKKSFSNGVNRTRAHHEALSIKKSAEIAAVFGPESVRSCKRTSSISSMRSSVSLEAGLGYLP